MDTIDPMGNVGPLSPKERKEFEEEYRHGTDLFKRALNEYSESTNMFQKEEFKEVMEKAMQVLNETARELKNKELLNKNRQIEKDFSDYQQHQSLEHKNKLVTDLDSAQKSV